MIDKKAVYKEKLMRSLERKYVKERDRLVSFIEYIFREHLNKQFVTNWHHEVMAEKLESVLRGESTRLIINIPPGHTKTEEITKMFPVWALGKRPDIKICATGYSTSLTQTYSQDARDYYKSNAYQRVFPRRSPIRDDQDTKEWWTNEAGGGYYATGTGGSITGRRFNCVTSDTLVKTDNGVIKIEDLDPSSHKVLSYNHATGKEEYKAVKAIKKTDGRKVYKLITTRGRIIKATGEHRFYTLEQGYVTMDRLKVGDTLLSYEYKNDMSNVWIGDGEKGLRSTESNETWKQKYVLLSRLFFSLCQFKKEEEVQKMWWLKRIWHKKVLRSLQASSQRGEKDENEKGLLAMLKRFLSSIEQANLLLQRVCKQSSFVANGGAREFSLQRRHKLCEMVPGDETDYLSKRLEQMRNLWDRGRIKFSRKARLGAATNKIKFSSTSYQRRPIGLQDGESSTSLYDMPCYSPQIKEDTISLVEPVCNELHSVYDIQVEENSNFFANEILVHNCFIIDDPLKPDEAISDLKRVGINNWYDNTVLSRLYNPLVDSVIIIMQRVHEDDLCGYLMNKMEEKTGEKFEVLSLPAIATENELYRKEGEALDANRFPVEALEKLKKGLGIVNFECQYQQNPVSKESQEFHEEWFRYYEQYPEHGRVFTTCDPAFSQKTSADESAVITAKFINDKMYILEITHGKYSPDQLEDILIQHCRKWNPEKIGIESFQAQQLIAFSLKNRLANETNYTTVEEIRQAGDKETKIRRLIPLYRNGLIYHHKDCKDLESQLLKFPRGRHDDIVDALQMLYNLYELQPNVKSYQKPVIKFDSYGRPVIDVDTNNWLEEIKIKS